MAPSVSSSRGSLKLQGKRILVVEDEPFIAFDIADTIEGEGGAVIGPAMSIRSALQLLARESIDGAIVDVNLPDGDIGPVIARLQELRVSCVVHTGAGLTPELQETYPHLRVFFKPTPPHLLTEAVAGQPGATA